MISRIRQQSADRLSGVGVRPDKAALSSGCKAHPATAPTGSNRSSQGGNELAEAFGGLAVSWCLAVNHSLPVRALQSAMSSMTDFSHSQKVGKRRIISYEFPPWDQPSTSTTSEVFPTPCLKQARSSQSWRRANTNNGASLGPIGHLSVASNISSFPPPNGSQDILPSILHDP